MDTELLLYLNSQEWKSIILRLTSYAEKRMLRHKYKANGKVLPGGKEGKDVAFQAITELFDGTRNWNRQEQPDLYLFLTSSVNSIVFNCGTSAEFERSVVVDYLEGEQETAFWDGIESGGNPEELLEYKELRDRCYEALCGAQSPDEEVFTCMIDGCKDKDIAEMLGLPIKEVRNSKKRLKRRLRMALSDFSIVSKGAENE